MAMVMGKRATGSLGIVLCIGLGLGLAGCDYWPPALQAEIEQLRSETQTLAAEKAQLQAQILELSKAKQDMQTQIGDLNRTSQEKTKMIASLQNQLDAMRAKALKAMSPPKKAKKPPLKSTTKPTTRPSTKKRAAPKR